MYIKLKCYNNLVLCDLSIEGDRIWLYSLYTPIELRNQGIATMALKAAKKIAKKHNKPLHLYAAPFGRSRPMSRRELTNYYNRMGFTGNSWRKLTYDPRGFEHHEH